MLRRSAGASARRKTVPYSPIVKAPPNRLVSVADGRREFGPISHYAARQRQRPSSQFENHERFAWHRVLVKKASGVRRREAEPGVILGMPDHDDSIVPERSTQIETGADQLRADALTLQLRQNRDRAKAENNGLRPGPVDPDGAEQNVTDDSIAGRSDQRDSFRRSAQRRRRAALQGGR
jgi:hypothetical protein